MNITLDLPYRIRDRLYKVEAKTKKIYKPCSLCNNTRKYTVSAEGNEYSIDCPKCSGKQLKGDTSQEPLVVQQYTTQELYIERVVVGDRHIHPRVFPCNNGEMKVLILAQAHDRYAMEYLDPETLKDQYGNQYYTDKKECAKKVREGNASEKKAIEAYLGGTVSGD